MVYWFFSVCRVSLFLLSLASLFFGLSLPVRSQALIKREVSEETQDTKCKMVASYCFFSPPPFLLVVGRE
jgi:hypothetical protein